MSYIIFILPLIAIGFLMLPLVPVFSGVKTGAQAKRRFMFHLCGFFGVLILIVAFSMCNAVFAANDPSNASSGGFYMGEGLKYIGAALSTGLASIGAGIGVGGGAPAAIGACSEDPKAFGKAMIFVVLGEGIAIYGLVISFLILFAA